MPLTGSLEDIPVFDILQLLHLSQKSGTLVINHGAERAELLFIEGKIAGATTTDYGQRIGEFLLSEKLLSREQLSFALKKQEVEGNIRALGTILLELEFISFENLEKALSTYIQNVIAYIAGWDYGEFFFEMDQVRAIDEISIMPPDQLQQFNINTQGLILEAVRIFDERNREGVTPITSKQSTAIKVQTQEDVELSKHLQDVLEGKGLPERLKKRVILLNSDGFIRHTIKDICSEDNITIYIPTSISETYNWIDHALRDNVIPVVVIEAALETEKLSEEYSGLVAARKIKEDYPEIQIIMFGDMEKPELAEHSLHLGIRGYIARPTRKEEYKDYVSNMDKFLRQLRAAFSGVFKEEDLMRRQKAAYFQQLKELRERIQNLKSHEHTSTVSLEVLRYIAEHLERSILFLVRLADIMALGAFGNTANGNPLSSFLMQLRFSLTEQSEFRNTVLQQKPFKGVLHPQSAVHERFYKLIGYPENPEAIILSLKIEEKPVVIIYADNGSNKERIIDYDSLQILTTHAGIILENVFLRKQREVNKRKLSKPEVAS